MDFVFFTLVTERDRHLPLYLTSAGQWGNQDPVQRPEGFASYQLLLPLSGEGTLHADGHSYPVKTGQVICLFPNVPHRYEADIEPWGMLFIAFEGSLCAPLLEQAGIHRSGAYTVSDPEGLHADLMPILDSVNEEGPFDAAGASKLLYSLLLDLDKVISTNRHQVHLHVQRLQPVLNYIREHCHRALTIQQLAEQAGITPQYLCSLFKSTMNLRPMEYVNRERINRSKQLIFQEPGLKIHEIARQSGFEHGSYFCTVFKKLEGVTPEQFKRSHGLQP
ncbi:helix-turn-helix transcriptional regulator [Paenibacillus lemnae]|uniref:AraC family transcriptional regulator n=1 Tax=Paenibacillus lemnae TaxID=1330551 RepID=A0A848M4P6_PAELE|nr:AraC family transcriptional regulator [Paenibacillus lemnae]NMO95082.1 AraC family transcriptional regulator [Paenibacillus lemnae]